MGRKRRSISPKTRMRVWARDKFTCQYCGRSAPNVVLEVDHVVSVAQGDPDEIGNYITACFDCNRGKGDMQWTEDYQLATNPKERERRFQSYRVRRIGESGEIESILTHVAFMDIDDIWQVVCEKQRQQSHLEVEIAWLTDRAKQLSDWKKMLEERKERETKPHPPGCQCPDCRPAA